MIPDDYKKIDELCTLVNGNGFKPHEWSDSGYPIIRIQNLNGSREFNYYAQEPKEKWIIKNGDLLFAWAGVKGVSFGPTIWNGSTGVLNQHIYKIVPNKGVNKLWLYSMLSIITSQIESKAHGFKSSLLHVHKSDITDQIVRLPPLSEQCKIAEILGVWDEAIDLLEKLVASNRSRKQGLMQQLLTGKKRFKEFESSEWKKVSIGEIAFVDKRSLNNSTPKDYTFFYISLSDVDNGHIADNLEYLCFEKAPSRARRLVNNNDILMATVRPNLKSFAIVKTDADKYVVSTGFAVVTAKKDYAPDYLYQYIFSNHIEKQIEALVTGSNYPAINSTEIKNLSVYCPPLPEQEKIAAVLTAADEEIATLEKQLAAYKRQKIGLMQQLLTGRIRI
jgi:type I restriction enzyme, S subunit